MTVLSAKDLDLSDPLLRRAVDLLIAHQDAACAGDEDRADEILGDLELPLRRLTWAQNEWLRGVSGDLQMLSGEEVFETNQHTAEEYQAKVQRAWFDVAEDPNALLALLRKKQGFLSAGQVACGRSRAYRVLGFPELRLKFLHHAVHLEPDNVLYKSFLLDWLVEQGRTLEAAELASDLLADSETPPLIVTGAALVLRDQALTLSAPQARPALGKIRRRLEALLNGTTEEQIEREQKSIALMLLAQICLHLGRRADAERWLVRAVAVNPNDDLAYAALGTVLYTTNRSAALRHFREAVRRQTHAAVPYLCLAQFHLGEGQYSECRQLSEQALALTDAPELTATAHALIGLAEFEEHGPTDEALHQVGVARDLVPGNVAFQHNYEVVQAARGRGSERTDDASAREASSRETTDIISEALLSEPQSWGQLSRRVTQQSRLEMAIAA